MSSPQVLLTISTSSSSTPSRSTATEKGDLIGHHVYKSPSSSGVNRIVICAASVFLLIGLLCLPAHPIIAIPFLLIAGKMFYDIIKPSLAYNELEDALKQATSKKNINDLPEVTWKLKNSGDLETIRHDDMSAPVMCLKDKGNALAVAYKYIDNTNFVPEKVVKVFSFKGKFSPVWMSTSEEERSEHEHAPGLLTQTFEAAKSRFIVTDQMEEKDYIPLIKAAIEQEHNCKPS